MSQNKLEKKIDDELENLAKKTGSYAFRISGSSKDTGGLANKFFIIPNNQFYKQLQQSTIFLNNTVTPTTVSLMGDLKTPLAFDKGQGYLEKWGENPWNRNWHLWLRVGKNLYNNSLVRATTFGWPDHIHSDKWDCISTNLNKDYPLNWMNLMLSPILNVSPAFFSGMKKVLDAQVWTTYSKVTSLIQSLCKDVGLENQYQDIINALNDKDKEKLAIICLFKKMRGLHANDAQQAKAIDSALEKLVPFALPENRLDTLEHLVLHDHIHYPPMENPLVNLKTIIPFHKFSVLSNKEDGAKLDKANCLNLFFQLKEKAFIKAIKASGLLKKEELDALQAFQKVMFKHSLCNVYAQYFDDLILKRDACYTSSELLTRTLCSPLNSVVFLEGAYPIYKKRQDEKEKKSFTLPWKEMGLPKKLASILNDPKKRIVISTGKVSHNQQGFFKDNYQLFNGLSNQEVKIRQPLKEITIDENIPVSTNQVGDQKKKIFSI